MKSRIWNSIGIAVLAAAIAFSLFQLRIPVVKASGCPDAGSVGCNCTFTYGLHWMENGVEHGECHYDCGCCDCWPSGDVQNFYIEREYVHNY